LGTIHLIVEFVSFGATTLLNVTITNKPIEDWLEVGSGDGYGSYWLNLSKAYTDNDTSV
jgi:hypothetical protein